MDCLALMLDGRGLVDEPYKDGTGSEHGIYQTYKLALSLFRPPKDWHELLLRRRQTFLIRRL